MYTMYIMYILYISCTYYISCPASRDDYIVITDWAGCKCKTWTLDWTGLCGAVCAKSVIFSFYIYLCIN